MHLAKSTAAAACALLLGGTIGAHIADAKPPPFAGKKSHPGNGGGPPAGVPPHRPNPPPTTIYDPYPQGFLPSNLDSEINRVLNEIDGIFAATLAASQALPINPGTAMQQVQVLGKLELYDRNLSVFRNVACTSCHMPYTGFTGPISSVNATTVAYPGSV